MASPDDKLADFRRAIDEIDDQFLDLLARRTDIALQVARVKPKDRPGIRPGREAMILRRVAEANRCAFSTRALLRMWRELMSATLAAEGPFAVALQRNDAGPDLWEVARDQYGVNTTYKPMASPHQVLRAVREGQVQVGVLPLPQDDDTDPWWRLMFSTDPMAPRVIARLPFVRPSDQPEALVVASLVAEATGADHTLLALECRGRISRGRLVDGIRAQNFEPLRILDWSDPVSPDHRVHLLELAGHATPDDPRLASLQAALEAEDARVVHLGAYAVPLELGPEG